MATKLVVSSGAWDRWRDEVRAGLRTFEAPTDALYFAALCDSLGLDRADEYRESGEESLLRRAEVWFTQSRWWLARMPAEELVP